MSDVKHTPGEWFSREHVRGGLDIVSDNGVLAVVCQPNNMPFDVCEANADLFAAAPRLLAACKSVLAGLKQMGSDWSDEQQEIVSAAIAKATGK